MDSDSSGFRMRHIELRAAGPSRRPMLTHTLTMFGAGTKNNSRVIPADPRTNIARSRSRGTVIFTHNRANLLDRAP